MRHGADNRSTILCTVWHAGGGSEANRQAAGNSAAWPGANASRRAHRASRLCSSGSSEGSDHGDGATCDTGYTRSSSCASTTSGTIATCRCSCPRSSARKQAGDWAASGDINTGTAGHPRVQRSDGGCDGRQRTIAANYTRHERVCARSAADHLTRRRTNVLERRQACA